MSKRLNEEQIDRVKEISKGLRAELESKGQAKFRPPPIEAMETDPDWDVWNAVITDLHTHGMVTYPASNDEPFVITRSGPTL